MSTLWARRSLAFLLLEHFASSVIVTETCLQKQQFAHSLFKQYTNKQIRLMKILTLHRRQECWPRRLQDKPEIGAKVNKVEHLIVKNIQKNTGNERRTFISLCFQDLTARLVFELIILTQEVVAKTAAENATTCTLYNKQDLIGFSNHIKAEHSWFTVR